MCDKEKMFENISFLTDYLKTQPINRMLFDKDESFNIYSITDDILDVPEEDNTLVDFLITDNLGNQNVALVNINKKVLESLDRSDKQFYHINVEVGHKKLHIITFDIVDLNEECLKRI